MSSLGVEVLAQDSADVFADGSRTSAPQARRVPDYFYLRCNLGTELRAVVAHHHTAIRAVGRGS